MMDASIGHARGPASGGRVSALVSRNARPNSKRNASRMTAAAGSGWKASSAWTFPHRALQSSTPKMQCVRRGARSVTFTPGTQLGHVSHGAAAPAARCPAQVEKINTKHFRSERVPPRLRGCAFDGQGVRNGRLSRHLLTGGWRGRSAMSAAFILLALSAATGFAIGTSFSWFAILISSTALAALSAAVLQIAGIRCFVRNCDHRYLFGRAPVRLRYGRGRRQPCFGGGPEITRASRQDRRSKWLAPLALGHLRPWQEDLGL